jgi:hypothetical protein
LPDPIALIRVIMMTYLNLIINVLIFYW